MFFKRGYPTYSHGNIYGVLARVSPLTQIQKLKTGDYMRYTIDTEKELNIEEYTDDDGDFTITVEEVIRDTSSSMLKHKTLDDFKEADILMNEADSEIMQRVEILTNEIKRLLNIRDDLKSTQKKLDELYISHAIFNAHNRI
jgi:hypothetical protein